jgi:hypothetical protein
MKKSLLFFILISFTPSIWAEPTNGRYLMPRSRSFMKELISRYLKWQEDHYKVSALGALKTLHQQNIVKEALDSIDHWKVPGTPFNQFEAHYAPQFFKWRIYLNESIRSKYQALTNVWFYEWSSSGDVCLWRQISSSSWDIDCGKDSTKMTAKIDYDLALLSHIDPFHRISHQLFSIWKDDQLIEVQFECFSTEIEFVPQAYRSPIVSHGNALFLPFEKYAITPSAEMRVIYP